jgi:hypothetical protein
MLSKVSLRLKLSDFINTDIEEEVMNKVNHAHTELNVTVILYLWFEEGDVSNKELKDFLMRWENKLSFKTIVKQGHQLHINEYIYFDIIPDTVLKSNISKRFSYGYMTSDKILDGLRQFYNVTKFTTTDKPYKKQKRNDYAD